MSVLNPDQGYSDTNATSTTGSSSVDLELSDLEHRSLESLTSEAKLQFDSFANSVASISQLPRREFLRNLADLAVRFGRNILTIFEAIDAIPQTNKTDEEKKSQALNSMNYLDNLELVQPVLFSAYKSQVQTDNRFDQQEKELISAAYDYLIAQNKLAIGDRDKHKDDSEDADPWDHQIFIMDNEELLHATPEYINFLSILKKVSPSLDNDTFISKAHNFEAEFQIRSALDGQDEQDTLGYYISQRIASIQDGDEDEIVGYIVNPYNYTGDVRGLAKLLKENWN